jgi:dextranase
MYRHADLLPPQDEFVDPLGRPLSLESVRRLAASFAAAGSLPLGYAAVYAAGRDEWPSWERDGLFRPNGEPWDLGGFLWNVDPTSARWQEHFSADLRRAVDAVGFAGFHLDQYGAPKVALRRDGTRVDLAQAFPALLEHLARELPQARLIFNNVNDFPTWSTAGTPQAAVYIEVWPPHERLADEARLIERARALAPEKSVIVAAYLSVYAQDGVDERAAAAAQSLLLATAFSHGGSALLHGEAQAALTHPYYANHATIADASQHAAGRYYDFAVRYGDLLFDRAAVDVTRVVAGGVNEDLAVDAPVPIAFSAEAGALWLRAVRLSHGLLVSLIDLSGQPDDRWDAPKAEPRALAPVRLSLQRTGRAAPRFLFADPDERPGMVDLHADACDGRDVVELPAFATWALVWIPDPPVEVS